MNTHDKTLVLRLNESDKSAFQEIYSRFYNAVYSFVSQYIKDSEQIRDIVHDSFLEIWTNREQIDSERGYRSLVIRIARNKSLNYLRSRSSFDKYSNSVQSRENELMIRALQDSSMDKLLYEEASGVLYQIIAQLPDKYKEVFLLSRKHGLTNAQIADRIGISRKTVEYRIMCALRQIRREYEDFFR